MSDIHANLPALQAVLKDVGAFDRLVFLGDLANFGPHPSECVDLLKEYNPICIIGNHDAQIISECPKNFWDRWSKEQLNNLQKDWISTFEESTILDGHILLVHGSYTVDYDILPNTPSQKIVDAFKRLLKPGIDQVWFGHYHYGIDRVIEGVEYHCIRPVGHHRDKDNRAGYSVYEDGCLIHKRVSYDLDKTIKDFEKMSDIFPNREAAEEYTVLMKNAYHPQLLKKDIEQMAKNEKECTEYE